MPSAPSPPGPKLDRRGEEDPLGSRAAGPAALRGSFMRGGSYALTILLSLISAPLLIRHLGIAAFGRYTIVISIVTIVGGLTDAGLLNVALRQWVTRSGGERTGLARRLLGARLLLSGGAVGVGVGFAAAAGYDRQLLLGTLIAGVGMMLQAVAHFLTIPLQAELRFGWTSLVDLVRQLVAVLLIVALVITGASLLPFFMVLIVSGAAMVALAAVLVRGRMPLVPRLRGAGWWPLVRDTLPYAAAVALNTVYFRLTIVVMSLIATARQTGYFATSFRVTEVLVGVPALAIGAAFPILSHAAASDRRRFADASRRIIELSLLCGVAVSLGVVLSAPFVIEVLAGGAGKPAVAVLQIQGLALIGTFLATAAAYPLLSLRRHGALMAANAAALAVNVALTLVLVPLAHARGAAVAAVAAEGVLAAAQITLLVRYGGTRLRPGAFPPVLVAGLVGAAPLLIVGLSPLLRTLLGIGAYAGVLLLLGEFPPELREALGRNRGPRPQP